MQVLGLVVGIAALAAPHAPTAADEVGAAIAAANERFEAAFNSGRVKDLASLYTTDGAVLPPGGPTTTGREGIESFWRGVRESGVARVDLETVELEAHGDFAVEVGRAVLTVEAADGSTSAQGVKYLVVWKRSAGGAWELYRDIWNAGPSS